LGVVFGAVGLAAALAILLALGYVDFGADRQPSRLESKLAMNAVDAWADRGSRDARNSLTGSEENITAGATLYLNHCAGCHGVPSHPESQFQRSFYPPAPGFFREAPDMDPAETFYVIKRGIRWTGMPAWSATLTDEQIWQIVAFADNLQKLPPSATKVFEPVATSPTNPK
jgi:mono/diheme cytochrome c family protein